MKIHVRNQKCVRRISFQNMKAARTRNIVAILAISLTAVLFTAIFTIALSIVYGYEQSNFRQVGGYAHGDFKFLTKKQLEELCEDPLIREYGVRRFLGVPYEAPFHKSHVEISYADANYAKWSFLEPVEGRLPAEGTDEAATDTAVLALLGVEPEIGAKFTMTFNVDGVRTTETFTLCGFWEYDRVSPANHVLLPESRVQEILNSTNCQCLDGMTGLYALEIMFPNSAHIEEDLLDVVARHGYQSENRAEEDTYIHAGVNWGYINVQSADYLDLQTILAVLLIVFIIMLTGYLIIYNIFQISIANDIRFYGLLKTIGTTGKQLRHMIFLQAAVLSAAGIPAGLLIGYGVGAVLTPIVLKNLNVYQGALSISPWIFAGSALFSFLTVIVSCRRPGRIAAGVSPIDAVRYTDGISSRARNGKRHTFLRGGLFRMAWANLGRNRKKTALTVISLSLSVVLLNMTVTLTDGFDMDKYLRNITADFIFAHTGYFQTGAGHPDFSEEMGVSEDAVAAVNAQGGIAAGGKTYGKYGIAQEFVTEDYYRQSYGRFYSESQIDERLADAEKENGLITDTVQLYGMEPFCLDKLTVLEGDLSGLYEDGDSHYIAAVYEQNADGSAREGSNWPKVGDRMTIRYIDETEIYNTLTGEIYPDVESIPEAERQYADVRILKQRDIEYEVAALVDIPAAITYRYYGRDEFVMGADTFCRDTGTDAVMYYLFDMEEDAAESMENYIAGLTGKSMPQYAYESKKLYMEGFAAEKRMYRLCGSVLSLIIGFIGILNFFNVILTNVIARRKEFAVLQSVGMTGRQLKKMLMMEGELLTLGSLAFSLLLTLATAPFAADALSSVFWFFSYHFTVTPLLFIMPVFALIGLLVPLIAYRQTARKSIVERLREGE